LFLDTSTPEDGSTAFLQNNGELLSYQDHIPECVNASFMYKLDISGGGGTVVIVAVLQTGKLGNWGEMPRRGKHYFLPYSMYIVMGLPDLLSSD
jgi:hypothetical protein